MTISEVNDVLYQVYHSTGIKYNNTKNIIAKDLYAIFEIFNISKEEATRLLILSIHDQAIEQHYNWN